MESKNKIMDENGLITFRKENKESYYKIYEKYGSLMQRLKYNQGILMYVLDKGSRRSELENKLTHILHKFIGNSEFCGFNENDEELLQVVRLGENIIKREREYIEFWIPLQQLIVFLAILGLGAFLIYMLIIKK